jgi:hypothetical protein
MKHLCKFSLLAALVAASTATAAPIVYEDRDAFVAATNPNALVDFNDLEAGQSFKDKTLSVGPFSLYTDSPANGGNHVRDGSDGFNIDGSNFVFGIAREGHPIEFDFLAPVFAWGATFKDLGDVNRFTVLRFFDELSNVVGEINVFDREDLTIEFFGIDLGGAKATRMEIALPLDSPSDNFSFDNVALTLDRAQPAPVPLPASAMFFATGGLALAALRRRGKGG